MSWGLLCLFTPLLAFLPELLEQQCWREVLSWERIPLQLTIRAPSRGSVTCVNENLRMAGESGVLPWKTGTASPLAGWVRGRAGAPPPPTSPLPVVSRLLRLWSPGQAGVKRSISSHINKQGFTAVRESGLQR